MPYAIARWRSASVVVLEAEHHLAAHQSGHNSGVIHSGLYYKPGSRKAENCVSGRKALYRFCHDNAIAHQQTGKLVIATTESELPALAEEDEVAVQLSDEHLAHAAGQIRAISASAQKTVAA